MEGVIRYNKKQYKQKTKNKHSLKDCTEQFFKLSYKNIIHDKILLFNAALLVQKTRCGWVTLNEVLNNSGLVSNKYISSYKTIDS